MTVYIVKCLDSLDYERWLGKRKTFCLDGKAMEQYVVPGEPSMEYVWDWSISNQTLKHPQRWMAEKLMQDQASKFKGLKIWVAKIEWNGEE